MNNTNQVALAKRCLRGILDLKEYLFILLKMPITPKVGNGFYITNSRQGIRMSRGTKPTLKWKKFCA
jgi:hypothetical protein